MQEIKTIHKTNKSNSLGMWRMVCTAIVLCFATAVVGNAQIFTTLTSLAPSVNYPISPLLQGLDGNFYSVTKDGGVKNIYCLDSPNAGCGTIFKITPTGSLTVAATFCGHPQCPLGYGPSSLIRGIDGNFYGTAFGGGSNSSTNCTHGCGTVFKFTTTGNLSTLYNFCSEANCADGWQPTSLMQATSGGVYGDFYGTTEFGGMSMDCFTGIAGCGTIFRLTPQGQETTLYSFTPSFYFGGQLVQTAGGNFYGAGSMSSADCNFGTNCGAIFRMTQSGTVTPLKRFSQPSGPNSPPILGTDGFLYGTTQFGGNISQNAPDCPEGCGTVFKMSTSGNLTTLYKFCSLSNCSDGVGGLAGLIQASDGNFYGTGNTIYKITPSGVLTTLYTFCAQPNCADGSGSLWPLVQGTDGKLYGITQDGGTDKQGTIFSLDAGLPPFVTFLASTGNVGNTVGILGQGFTGTTAVSFNGTAATFTVKSDTYLTATVPTGATTGSVTVTTPSGTLTSNVAYRVTQ